MTTPADDVVHLIESASQFLRRTTPNLKGLSDVEELSMHWNGLMRKMNPSKGYQNDAQDRGDHELAVVNISEEDRTAMDNFIDKCEAAREKYDEYISTARHYLDALQTIQPSKDLSSTMNPRLAILLDEFAKFEDACGDILKCTIPALVENVNELFVRSSAKK